ncbi:hypothetical protein INT47_008905, partial [Mucor saturninus]
EDGDGFIVAGEFTESEESSSDESLEDYRPQHRMDLGTPVALYDEILDDNYHVIDFFELATSRYADSVLTGEYVTSTGERKDIFVDMNLPISELVICETNVDAFISNCLRDIPVKTSNRMRLFLSPGYNTAMTRLDFGYYQFNNEKKPVKDYHHCLLMEMQGQALLQVHVIFPNMTELGLNLDSNSMALESELQKKFIDKLFLPACKAVLPESAYNRCGGSYAESVSRGLFNSIANTSVSSDSLAAVVEAMRHLVRENQSLAMFRHFRFVMSAFGFKAPFDGENYEEILPNMLAWNQLNPRKVQVDIGVNFFVRGAGPLAPLKLVTFLKEEFVTFAGELVGGDSTVSKPMDMALGRFGGLHGKNKSPGVGEASKVIFYNDIKAPFTMREPGFNGSVADEWSPAKTRSTVFHTDGHYMSKRKRYESRMSQYHSTQFTMRLEVRVAAGDVDVSLLANLQRKIRALNDMGAFVHVQNAAYFGYVSRILKATGRIIQSFESSLILENVSGLALAVYVMNSLFHPGNASSTCAKNYVGENRCPNNRLCFLPGAFSFVNDTISFNHTFDFTRMKKMFPGVKIVPTMTINGDRVLDELERMAADGEVDSDDLSIAHMQAVVATSGFVAPVRSLEFAPLVTFSGLACELVPLSSSVVLEDVCLFDSRNASTVEHADRARQIFYRFGLGPESAVRFLDIFFSELFCLAGEGFAGCGISNLAFGGDHSKLNPEIRSERDVIPRMSVVERLCFLLPLVSSSDSNVDWVKSLVAGRGVDSKWITFGSRSVWLGLSLNENIRHEDLQKFHGLLMVACLFVLEYVPICCCSKMFRPLTDCTMIVRKISWFSEPYSDLTPQLFSFLSSYAKNYKHTDSNFPRLPSSYLFSSTATATRPSRPIKRRKNGRVY